MDAKPNQARALIWAAASCALALLGSCPALAQGRQPPQKPPLGQNDPRQPAPPGQAEAQDSAPSASATATAPQGLGPWVHHSPVSVAKSRTELPIEAFIDRPQELRQALVVYKIESGAVRSVPFQRSSVGPYLAVVPATDLVGSKLGYTIEIEDTRGRRTSVFATRESMQQVQIQEDTAELQERALAQRLEQHRSVAMTWGEAVFFGRSNALVSTAENAVPTLQSVPDQYYRLEGSYTYRPLGTIAEFSIKLGVVRGTARVPGETDRSKYDVGLNYGSPSVRFRLEEYWHLELSFLTSVTEVGFSAGGGGALLIGDPYGTKLTLGVESIKTFGTRFYSRMDIQANQRLQIAPIIEVTDMPHADRYGVRLLGEARYYVGAGLTVGVRGGYQSRVSTGGGAAAGGVLSYAF